MPQFIYGWGEPDRNVVNVVGVFDNEDTHSVGQIIKLGFFSYAVITDEQFEGVGGLFKIAGRVFDKDTGMFEPLGDMAEERFVEVLDEFKKMFDQVESHWERLELWRIHNPIEVELSDGSMMKWADAVVKGWIKPWTAHCIALIEKAKADVNDANVTACENAITADSRSYKFEFQTLGIHTWYGAADRSNTLWANVAATGGTSVYATDADTGGIDGAPVGVANYGEHTVDTYPLRDKVNAL